MHYGQLTTTQQSSFLKELAKKIREPSFTVFISGFGDITGYAISITTSRSIESPLGRGNINIGDAGIYAHNQDGYFYSDGASNIPIGAHVEIYSGYNKLNIPIFTGYVSSVKPDGRNETVTITCKDYMGLFNDARVSGSQGDNNTAKLILESFASSVYLTSSLSSGTELTATYDSTTFDDMTVKLATEKICDSIFHCAYFDEDGILQCVEREYYTDTDFIFDDSNILELIQLIPTSIINTVNIEYRDGFTIHRYITASQDAYGIHERNLYNTLFNSVLVADKVQGSTSEAMDNTLEGFTFISSSSSADYIDCIRVRMCQDGASGIITAKLYSDNSGPDTLLATSDSIMAGTLPESFAWVAFNLSSVAIAPSTNYWLIIDKGTTTGDIYFQISAAAATSKHAYNDGSWHLQDNKYILHQIRGSKSAQRVADDMIYFYREPLERLRLEAWSYPQLQLFDMVSVNSDTMGIYGKYIIESITHKLLEDNHRTSLTLRKLR